MMNMNMETMYTDYLSGEVFEKVLNEVGYNEFLENQFILEDELDVMVQLYNNESFKRAKERAKQDNQSIDLEFYFDDIFVNTDLKSYDLIQNLVNVAWKDVRREEYFKKIVSNLDEELLEVLSRIYID